MIAGKMNKQRLKETIYNLRKQRHMIETYLLNNREQMPIWISSQYTYCKKGNCKCTKGSPHGPFWYLFFKEGNKVVHRYIPKSKLAQIRQLADSYKRYNERLAILNKINKQIYTLLRINQQENLIPVPKWIKQQRVKKKR